MAATEAIIVAMELVRNPVLTHATRAAPLPQGMEMLLQIAIGVPEVIAEAASVTSVPDAKLRYAASFFIEQILLDPAADSYRRLGVTRAATSRDLRRHMTYLLRWLHPDVATLSASGLDCTHFAPRITRAWEDLKTASRRARYDATSAAPVHSKVRFRKAGVQAPSHPLGDPSTNTNRAPPRDGVRNTCTADKPRLKGRRFRRVRLFHLGNDGILTRLFEILSGRGR